MSDYLDRWLTDSVRGSVRESTYSRDKYLVTNHVKPALGRVKLKNLDAMHLQRLYREQRDAGLSAPRSRRSTTSYTRGSGRPLGI